MLMTPTGFILCSSFNDRILWANVQQAQALAMPKVAGLATLLDDIDKALGCAEEGRNGRGLVVLDVEEPYTLVILSRSPILLVRVPFSGNGTRTHGFFQSVRLFNSSTISINL